MFQRQKFSNRKIKPQPIVKPSKKHNLKTSHHQFSPPHFIFCFKTNAKRNWWKKRRYKKRHGFKMESALRKLNFSCNRTDGVGRRERGDATRKDTFKGLDINCPCVIVNGSGERVGTILQWTLHCRPSVVSMSVKYTLSILAFNHSDTAFSPFTRNKT